MKRFGKKSLIAGVLALGFLVAGGSYAASKNQLHIQGTASTADLDINFVNLGVESYFDHENNWKNVESSSYEEAKKNYDEAKKSYYEAGFTGKLTDDKLMKYDNQKGSEKIKLDLNKLYPGFAMFYKAEILNNGSIPARLADIHMKMEGNELNNAQHMLGISLVIGKPSETEKSLHSKFGKFNLVEDTEFRPEDIFSLGNEKNEKNEKFIRFSAINDKKFHDYLRKHIILSMPDQDDKKPISIRIAMDPDAKGVYTSGTVSKQNMSGNDKDSQKKAGSLTIDMLWAQDNSSSYLTDYFDRQK